MKLAHSGKKSRITGFSDPSISDSKAVIDLVDSCKKGSINYDMVKPGHLEEVCICPCISFVKVFETIPDRQGFFKFCFEMSQRTVSN